MSHEGRSSSDRIGSEKEERNGAREGYGFGRVRCARGRIAAKVVSSTAAAAGRVQSEAGKEPFVVVAELLGWFRDSSGDGMGVSWRAGEGVGEGGASEEGVSRAALFGVAGCSSLLSRSRRASASFGGAASDGRVPW